jgi:hypothetical protein
MQETSLSSSGGYTLRDRQVFKDKQADIIIAPKWPEVDTHRTVSIALE